MAKTATPLQVRVTEELREQASILAVQRGCSVSELIRSLIEAEAGMPPRGRWLSDEEIALLRRTAAKASKPSMAACDD